MPIKARILLNKKALSSMVVGCVMLATFYSSLPFLFNELTNDSITKYSYYKYVLKLYARLVRSDLTWPVSRSISTQMN